jgi:hypothetical protein
MRLWSLHPRYLDAKGLVALWREGLLAKAVLSGQTRGYLHHPQLDRFRTHDRPLAAIDAYLAAVLEESLARGYRFDRSKTGPAHDVQPIAVTTGQLAWEWRHLAQKLVLRDPARLARCAAVRSPDCHPLFRRGPGPVAEWERGRGPPRDHAPSTQNFTPTRA